MNMADDAGGILFRLHSNKIYTNTKDSREDMRHVDSLKFSLINVSGADIVLDGSLGACFLLSFLVGESSKCLFSSKTADADMGVIRGPEGFQPSQVIRNPIKKNQVRMRMAVKDTASVCLPPGKALSFSWENICINSPEGFVTLAVTFSGIAALESLRLAQFLYKECIYANIPCFYASPSGGAPGSRITLHWKAENADAGYILPLGKNIMNAAGFADEAFDVVLTENTHFYLNIDNPHGNSYRDTYAQLIPPVIAALSIDAGRKLSWEVHFADKVQLNLDGIYQDAESTGSAVVQAGINTISLKCGGLYTLTRHLAVPPCPEITACYLDVWTFPSHQCTILTWRTKGLRSLELVVRDNAYHKHTLLPEGTFEQVYSLESPAAFQLNYESAAGRGTLYLANVPDK